MNLRPLLRRVFYTQNTVRYRAEWRCIKGAWQHIGKGGHLFDGGAGSGEFARKALAAGLCDKVTALEFDPDNLERLTENLGSRPDAIVRQGSILDIPFPDAAFDVVQCTQVLEHIAEHEKAASELARVLKPGGYAIITVPHPPEPFPNEGHVREGYTEADLSSLFAPFGFEHLLTDWFLTRDTVRWMLRGDRMPLGGVFLPVALVDREAGLNTAQRSQRQPFGILTLFRKKP